MVKKKYELTKSEWSIIQAIWSKQPCTAPDVQQFLEKETKWSYSTIKTLMDRMVGKGLLKTKKIRNLIFYSSVVTQKQAQSSEIMRAVKHAFNGSLTPMMQFLIDNENLSDSDLASLENLIREKQKKNN